MLESLLNENEGQIKEIKEKRRKAKNKVKTLSKRVSQMEKIRTKALNNFCDYAGQINSYINRCGDNLSSGLKGVSSVSISISDIDYEKESTAAPDEYYISSVIDKLTKEINNNNYEVRTLNTQIYTYESQIKELGGTIMPWE